MVSSSGLLVRRGAVASALLVTLAVVLAPACTAKQDEAPSCPGADCPVDMAAFEAGAPVSYRNQVLPLFQRSCNQDTCHGDGNRPDADADLLLGPGLGDLLPSPSERAALGERIVDVDSRTAPALKIVAPGDPARSFLMLKVDGCHTSAGLTCTAQDEDSTGCGERMPNGKDALCEDDRDLLRRWIAQGAVVD